MSEHHSEMQRRDDAYVIGTLRDEVARLRAENERLRLTIRKARLDLSEYGEPWTGAMIARVRSDLDAALKHD